jgi:hypothetical protein
MNVNAQDILLRWTWISSIRITTCIFSNLLSTHTIHPHCFNIVDSKSQSKELVPVFLIHAADHWSLLPSLEDSDDRATGPLPDYHPGTI